MQVELKSLKPNPLRDFIVDPIDKAVVETLTDSIKKHEFWGGVVCRRTKEGIEIVAGQHRVDAAIASGIKTADVFVSDNYDDATVVRVYAGENATQRGNMGTAQTGSIAAAIRYLAKGSITGELPEIRQLTDGIGWTHILDFLEGIPGIGKNSVVQQLANLKASGNYARIIEEVKKEVDKGKDEKAKEVAKKAADKAASTPITFDYVGVAKNLRNPHQVDKFRELVTKKEVSEHLPVNRQAELAEHVVKLAKEQETEVTGAFIKNNTVALIQNAKVVARGFTEKEKQALRNEDLKNKTKHLQDEFSRHCRGLYKAAIDLARIQEEWPANLDFVWTNEFTNNLNNVYQVLTSLKRGIKA